MTDLLITNGMLFTADDKDTLIDSGAVYIKNGRIADIGDSKTLEKKYPSARRLDATRMGVLPGLVNAHTHLSMTMTRSTADDIDAVAWLPVIWEVEKQNTPETVYAGALLGIAEMIASGTTTFNDHYFFMGEVAKAVEETGVRAELAEAILENQNKKKGSADLEKGKEFVSEWHGKANGRVRTRMGPHSLYTCSTDLIVRACQTAEELGVGVHMHAAESGLEMKLVGKAAKGPTSFQHLEGLGVLNDKFIAAHALNANEKDIEIIAKRGVGLAHCPQAYGKLGGYPFPKIDLWVKAGVHVGLGTDGVASNNNLDLFDEMRFASLVRKLQAKDGTVLPARQMLRLATIEGARALGLGDEIGSLEIGKKADIILVDCRKPHLYPLHNIPGNLVYSASGADVDTVIVDGKILMQGRKFKTLDIDEVLDRAQKTFEGMLKKAGWKPTIAEPSMDLAATLKLKATQRSLAMIQKLAWAKDTSETI